MKRSEGAGLKLNLLVLRVEDLEASRTFYAALGLDLVPEKHGDGPLHLSCDLQGTVMELYPRSREMRPTSLRLGFRVTRAALDRLTSSGSSPRLLRQTGGVATYLVRDPDENAIELEVAMDGVAAS